MKKVWREPTLDEILNDPTLDTLLARDGVSILRTRTRGRGARALQQALRRAACRRCQGCAAAPVVPVRHPIHCTTIFGHLMKVLGWGHAAILWSPRSRGPLPITPCIPR
jgi:hypothetical protein